MILSECSRAKNDQLALHFLRRQAESLPAQPVILASLAQGLAKFPELQSEALKVGSEAVALAKRENRQVRYSLTALVRLAMSLDEHSVLERALSELVADGNAARNEDTPFEFDFLDKVDATRISPKVLSAYKKLRR
jgi:hypothetical protein